MNADTFRRVALSMPHATEGEHMGHPDFRVNNKIFATLHAPEDHWGMVRLTPEQQEHFVHLHPDVFTPVKGGWGARGATQVLLKPAKVATLRPAMLAAWQNTAPRSLVGKPVPTRRRR